MEQEDNNNVLQHLLHLEAEASALVEDAQAEADRRLSESEKQCRSLFDKTYTEEAKRLEAVFIKEITAAREDYKKQLDTYRDELMKRPLNKAAFFDMAEELLGKELIGKRFPENSFARDA